VRLKTPAKFLAVLACAGLVLAACSSSPSSSSSSGVPTGGTRLTGGVVRFAEPPSATPNYIFPFMSAQYSSVNNISQFQYLMYRPLYMFGSPTTASPVFDAQLSLAQLPVYSNNNTQLSITMKNYKWSNGEQVTANDVLFFLNMMHAESSNWYAYVPGQIPDDVKSATANGQTLDMTLNGTYNTTWFTDNQLGQLTPMPEAWDITSAGAAPGSGGCSTGTYGAASTDKACTAVYNFLTSQASNISGYASSPIWSIVDGPWKLKSMDSSGDVALVPNPSYSGPVKPSISEFDEVPFTSEDSEFNALVGGQVTMGYLPTSDLTANAVSATQAGPNNPRLSGKYYMVPWILFGFNYAVPKFLSNSQGGALGKVFSQLYVRQAMQMLIDQPLYISKILKGYGVPTYGPVPLLPANSYIDSYTKSNPYPYNPSKAKSLLSSHGWSVVPGGTDTCTKPGTAADECGAGIPAGTKLAFNFVYPTGVNWQLQVVQAEASSFASAGIKVTLQGEVFNTVLSGYAAPCSNVSSCNVDFGWWGGGWSYEPDYYPTGELLFETGAGSNASNYSNPTTDNLIKQTNTSNVNLDQYQDNVANQLPDIWQPNADYQLSEFASNLRGAAPQSSYATIFPEYYYFAKS
jgi:peptide/nickel transport system substrate-binding protein